MEEYLTKTELSKLFKVHENTIDRWRKKGMPSIKVSRKVLFDKEQVTRWLKEKQN